MVITGYTDVGAKTLRRIGYTLVVGGDDDTVGITFQCPLCKSGVRYNKAKQELICPACRLAYPIRDDIPVMLSDEARELPADEEI